GARGAVPDLCLAVFIDRELERRRPLGAEGALIDGAVGVALDVDDAALAGVHQLAAADGTVRANAGHLAGSGDTRAPHLGLRPAEVHAETEETAEGEAAGSGGFEEFPTVEATLRG